MWPSHRTPQPPQALMQPVHHQYLRSLLSKSHHRPNSRDFLPPFNSANLLPSGALTLLTETQPWSSNLPHCLPRPSSRDTIGLSYSSRSLHNQSQLPEYLEPYINPHRLASIKAAMPLGRFIGYISFEVTLSPNSHELGMANNGVWCNRIGNIYLLYIHCTTIFLPNVLFQRWSTIPLVQR